MLSRLFDRGKSSKKSNDLDKVVPPPPAGATLELPKKPKSDIEITEFRGFSSPPPSKHRDSFKSYTENKSSEYNSIRKELFDNPRAQNCRLAVKTGCKIGFTVGSIFGGLSGAYAGILTRNLAIIPVSILGGGLTFGFFLGCGMLVRC